MAIHQPNGLRPCASSTAQLASESKKEADRNEAMSKMAGLDRW